MDSMEIEDSRQPVVVVVGVDFGTSRSGFAFSWLNDTSDTILKKNKYPDSNGTDPKTLTEIMYDNDSKEPVAFGYSARKKYTRLSKKDDGKYSYFSNFKMDLHRNNELKFSDGVKIEPEVIITDYLKYLVGLVIEEVSANIPKKIEIDQIRWVLTVPANWSDGNKFSMRKAAYQSGMISNLNETSERFLFALEPEAAGLYSCISMKKTEKLSELMMNEGENFMIIDAGGGTLDLTAHQVLKGGYLKELCTGKGASFGSTDVDKDFFAFVKNLVGEEVLAEFQRDYGKYYEEMRKNWIEIKESESEFTEDESVKVSSKFLTLLEKYKPELAEDFDCDIGIELSSKDIHGIFQGTLEDCSGVIENFFKVLENRKVNIDKILLVGGFGSSKLFQKHIKKEFSNRVSKILIPQDPSAAVLLGAVYYGKNKKLIKSRVLRRTYGVGAYADFEPKKHRLDKKVPFDTNSSRMLCKDLFDIWVRSGEEIEGERRIVKKYPVISENQKVMTFNIYSTSEYNPIYIDEFEDTQKDLSFSIQIAKGQLISQKVELDIYFGSTEVRIDVIHNGEKFEKKFILEDSTKKK